MKFATEDDFIEVYELFKKNRKLLPHIRMSKISNAIKIMGCIFNEEVICLSKIYKKSVQIGNTIG